MSENIILKNLDEPELLEDAYRNSPDTFEADLKAALDINESSETLRVWHARLNYSPTIATRRVSALILVLLCLVAGFFVKAPSIFLIDGDWYYPRFVPLIIIFGLIIYFLVSEANKIIKIYSIS